LWQRFNSNEIGLHNLLNQQLRDTVSGTYLKIFFRRIEQSDHDFPAVSSIYCARAVEHGYTVGQR
jgi:hypothetical protein